MRRAESEVLIVFGRRLVGRSVLCLFVVVLDVIFFVSGLELLVLKRPQLLRSDFEVLVSRAFVHVLLYVARARLQMTPFLRLVALGVAGVVGVGDVLVGDLLQRGLVREASGDGHSLVGGGVVGLGVHF